jgi:predicted nucleic acid-binding Zn ribbon protein
MAKIISLQINCIPPLSFCHFVTSRSSTKKIYRSQIHTLSHYIPKIINSVTFTVSLTIYTIFNSLFYSPKRCFMLCSSHTLHMPEMMLSCKQSHNVTSCSVLSVVVQKFHSQNIDPHTHTYLDNIDTRNRSRCALLDRARRRRDFDTLHYLLLALILLRQYLSSQRPYYLLKKSTHVPSIS